MQEENADAECRASNTLAASSLSAHPTTSVAAGSARAIPTAPPMLSSLVRSKGTPYGGRGALRKNSQTPALRTAPPRVKPIAVPSPDAIPTPPLTDTSPIVSPPLRMSYVDIVKNATPPASPPATGNGGATPTPDAVPAPEVPPQFEGKGPAPSPAGAAGAGSEETATGNPVAPALTQEAARTKAANAEAAAFFREHRGTVSEAENRLDHASSAYKEGQTVAGRLERQLRDLESAQRLEVREEQGSLSRRESVLAGAQRQLDAVRAAHHASLNQFRTNSTDSHCPLSMVASKQMKPPV